MRHCAGNFRKSPGRPRVLAHRLPSSPTAAILVLALAGALSGCIDAPSNRLAELPVMTTVPDGVEVVERASGSELGGWPSVGPIATVTYRVLEGDPQAVLEQIRATALDTGWEVAIDGYLRGSLNTDDGLARLSAYNPTATDTIVLTVWI